MALNLNNFTAAAAFNPSAPSTTPTNVASAGFANTGSYTDAGAASAGSQGYTASTLGNANAYNVSDTSSQGYTANTANQTNWNVDNNQTVQGQLQGIIAANSPLMQMARTDALKSMNQRGLLNSSMAIGAGQEAVTKQALPIAQADAATFAQAGKTNADWANNLAQFNTGQLNAAGQFGAAAANQAASQNAQQRTAAAQFAADAANRFKLEQAAATNRASEFGAAAANQASEQNAQRQTQTTLANRQNAADVSKFNAQQQNAVAEANAARIQQANLANAEAANNMARQSYDQSFKVAVANADAATKVTLQKIDATAREELAGIENRYKQLMQGSASASEAYQQAMKNIADIYNNPDLDATAIQSAVAAQTTTLTNAMNILSQLNDFF